MTKKVLDSKDEPVFGFLKDYKNIVVSGPQRSGTTACAGFVMTDLGLGKITRVSGGVNLDQLAKACAGKGRKVIHAAGCTYGLHREDIGGRDDTAVIWMWRDLEDVHKSEKRINWRPGAEFKRYDIKKREEVAPAKIKMFLEEQKDKIKHLYEIDYTELEKHSMYVSAEQRKNFSSRTWQIPKPRKKGPKPTKKGKKKPVPTPAPVITKKDQKKRLEKKRLARRKKKIEERAKAKRRLEEKKKNET